MHLCNFIPIYENEASICTGTVVRDKLKLPKLSLIAVSCLALVRGIDRSKWSSRRRRRGGGPTSPRTSPSPSPPASRSLSLSFAPAKALKGSLVDCAGSEPRAGGRRVRARRLLPLLARRLRLGAPLPLPLAGRRGGSGSSIPCAGR